MRKRHLSIYLNQHLLITHHMLHRRVFPCPHFFTSTPAQSTADRSLANSPAPLSPSGRLPIQMERSLTATSHRPRSRPSPPNGSAPSTLRMKPVPRSRRNCSHFPTHSSPK